jgi:sialidase-1
MELLVPLALSTLASAGGPHPPSPPSSWRVKGSNCGGTGCHYSATYSCECVAVTVMSAASAVDIPHLDDVPGLHVRSFRIPSIVSTPDVVVAFAEARQGAYGRGVCRDHEGHDLPSCPPGEHPALEPTDDMGPKTIAYKRSTNGGSSWGTLAFVPGLYQPNWVVGNAAAVYDARSGTIVLHVLNSTLMPAPLNDSMTNTGCTLQVTSSDAGRTWSRPTQLNGFLGRELRGIAPGPGNAIQLQHGPSKGRLVMPGWSTVCHDTESCVNGSLMGELTFAAVYYSDDSAQTWHVGSGAAVPRNLHGPVAEPSVAELSNGSLNLNMRNICSPSSGGELHNQSMCADVGMMAARMSSRSDDGALTFGPAEFVPGLPSPNDQGSILTGHADQQNAVAPLYFSGPYSKTSRSNMSIVASFDDGATWPAQTVVYPQAAKYSCLASLNDSHLALLVERHNGLYSSFDITFFAVKPPSRPGAPTPTPTPPGGGGGKITATCSNVSDCTAELQAAFVSGAGHVHIPMLPGGRAWLVGPLKLKSHQRITLAAGVEILAKKGAFQSK